MHICTHACTCTNIHMYLHSHSLRPNFTNSNTSKCAWAHQLVYLDSMLRTLVSGHTRGQALSITLHGGEWEERGPWPIGCMERLCDRCRKMPAPGQCPSPRHTTRRCRRMILAQKSAQKCRSLHEGGESGGRPRHRVGEGRPPHPPFMGIHGLLCSPGQNPSSHSLGRGAAGS